MQTTKNSVKCTRLSAPRRWLRAHVARQSIYLPNHSHEMYAYHGNCSRPNSSATQGPSHRRRVRRKRVRRSNLNNFVEARRRIAFGTGPLVIASLISQSQVNVLALLFAVHCFHFSLHLHHATRTLTPQFFLFHMHCTCTCSSILPRSGH